MTPSGRTRWIQVWNSGSDTVISWWRHHDHWRTKLECEFKVWSRVPNLELAFKFRLRSKSLGIRLGIKSQYIEPPLASLVAQAISATSGRYVGMIKFKSRTIDVTLCVLGANRCVCYYYFYVSHRGARRVRRSHPLMTQSIAAAAIAAWTCSSLLSFIATIIFICIALCFLFPHCHCCLF